MSTTRDDAVRAMLVDRVSATRRPNRWRLPLIGIGAFAAAGALTAGAIVGTSMQRTSDQHEVAAILASEGAGQNDFVGSPVERFVDGPTTLTLPPRPSGATGIVVGGQCSPTITLRVTIGSGRSTAVPCGQPATLIASPTSGDVRSVAVVPDRQGSLTVWAGWAMPHVTPGPSEQQQAEVADGIVTRSEYLAALNRYIGCMRALGHPMGTIGTRPTVFVWGIPGEALRASDDCQAAEYSETDALWQTEHPDADGQTYDPSTDDPRYAQ